MESRKGNTANRLLVVCMCLIVALMGLGSLSAPNVEAKGGGDVAWIRYMGPNVWIETGWNCITPLCSIRKPNNQSMTPEYWCDNFLVNGQPTNDKITSIETAKDGVVYKWVEATHSFLGGRSFTIDMMRSYYVCAIADGNLQTWPGLDGHSFVPKFYQQTLSSTYANYVGPMIPFVADPNGPPPPDPPPPWAPWYFNASDMRGYLFDANSNPYTGSYIIQILNETSQMYQTYDSTSPSTDYVIYGENAAGFIGYYTRGFKLTMPVSGCSIRCIVPW